MARKARASPTTTTAVATAATPPASGTRSKRKASALSVAVSMGSAPSVAATPTPAPVGSAISPALKKQRVARPKPNPIPFPPLDGSKVVINLYDDDDDDLDDEGCRIVSVMSSQHQRDYEAIMPARIAHPDFHLPTEYTGRVRVYHERGEYFDAMLTRACVYQQQNEFVLLQVLEVDDKGYCVWTRTGTIGATGDTVMEGPWPLAHDAVAKFRAVFLSKTLRHWDDRYTQGFGEGSFTWIETHQTMSDEEDAVAATLAAEAAVAPVAAPPPPATTQRKRRAAKKGRARTPRKTKPKPLTELSVDRALLPTSTTSPPSRLDESVQSFLSIIVEAANAYSHVDHRFYSYATMKQPQKTKTKASDDTVLVPIPLGKLTKATIEKGFDALHRLHDALQCHADRTALTHLSSLFYSVVPHPHLTVIDSMVQLTEKVEMLVALAVHGGHKELLLPELTQRYFQTNHLDACYDSLGCRLIPLLPTSREFGLVQSYIFNSFCCVGNNHGADGKLLSVFRVEKESEASRFSAYRTVPNRRVLWHGSRMSNWMGILKHGLLITPAGVPLNGSSLGAGLYFTDKISKAMAYSHSSHDRQVFLLSEVALGTCKPSVAGARGAAATATSAHHSCHGMGRCVPDSAGDYVDALGAVWPLGKATAAKDARATHGHNEFVVYNTAQARMRYLVVTKPLY